MGFVRQAQGTYSEFMNNLNIFDLCTILSIHGVLLLVTKTFAYKAFQPVSVVGFANAFFG